MNNVIQSISLARLVAHPDNPNRMSKTNFSRLVRNIERSGRYEPLIVRPCPNKRGYFQMINGHHRKLALEKLRYESADCVVWDIDDDQTNILLATLNRLGGIDEPGKKIRLLQRLSENFKTRELAKLLPLRAKQIDQLISLADSRTAMQNLKPVLSEAEGSTIENRKSMMPSAVVFFLDDEQRPILEEALSVACANRLENTKAQRRAAAITQIAESYLRSLDLTRTSLANEHQESTI
jgi:hypothetical protein